MPASTPLGIVYPCSGDTIDPDVFADYAQTTQDALNATQVLVDQALIPDRVAVNTPAGGVSIAAGATTVITYGSASYDTAGMFNSGSPTLLTIQSDGAYLVNLSFVTGGVPATHTSSRAAILLNGVEFAYMKQDAGTLASMQNPAWDVSAFLPRLVAGDQITTTHLFTGGGNLTIFESVAVTKISNT